MSNEDAELMEMLGIAIAHKSHEVEILLEKINEFQSSLSETLSSSCLDTDVITSLKVQVLEERYELALNTNIGPLISITKDSKVIPKNEVDLIESEDTMNFYDLKNLYNNKKLFIENLIKEINKL